MTVHDESECPCENGWVPSEGYDPGGFDAAHCGCPCHSATKESQC